MLIIFSIFSILQVQSARLKAIVAELDRKLDERYGDRYQRAKQQLEARLEGTKVWYEQNRSQAETSGTIPLAEKQAQTDRQAAEAGAGAARKEAAIKQQLKEIWHSIKNR
jgi:hypothetical protein